MINRLTLILFTGALLSFQCTAQSKPNGSAIQIAYEQQNKAVTETIDECKRLLAKDKLTFSDSVKLESRISLFGLLRAEQATSLLVQNVTRRTVGLMLEARAFADFPSVDALIQIGNPSVHEILRRMKPQISTATEYPERDLHLFAYVIRQVDGDEVGLFRLELEAKRATGTHKLNLLNLIDIYKLNETEAQIRVALTAEEK